MSQDEGVPPRDLFRQEATLVAALQENNTRYREQLAIHPGDDARRFIERCLAEEEAMLERLTGGPES